MDDEVVERPVCLTLSRQSSIETAPGADEQHQEPYYSRPRVVDVIVKVTPPASATEEAKPAEVHSLPEYAEVDQPTPRQTEKTEKPASEPAPEYAVVDKTTRQTAKTETVQDEKPASEPAPEYAAVDKTTRQTAKTETVLDEKPAAEPAPEYAVVDKTTRQTAKTVTVQDEKPTAETPSAPKEADAENEVQRRHSKDELEVPKAERKSSVGTLRGLSTTAMASPRPKSPRPPVAAARKDEKEESFWEKIGTLGRKKRIKEVQEVQEEGKYAIDSPGSPTAPDLPPEEYALEENEERSMIEPRSFDDPKLKELIAVLIEWINDELANQRIIVKDIEEDLYDGQVLQKLLEKLSGEKLDVPEVTQSEEGQKQKLGIVLAAANRVLGHPRWSIQKWSVESIHSKNLVAILHLLVALARHFRAPVRLPENVAVEVVVVQKREGSLSHRTVLEEITSTYDDLGMRGERDAFDTLFDHAPDKLQVVKKSLVTFVNKHLNKVNLEVTDLDTQFHDGVYLTILMGLLEGFFVPLYSFHLTPQDFEHKVHNVSFAFELMQDVGLAKPKARPEDIVNLDLKSTLRVLYNLFTKYKNMS